MRNVVLICLDTVRKDFFDEHAPRIRARADRSYEQCRAASSWSIPSHASMMTGALPHQHGVHDHNRDFSGITESATFLADLPDHHTTGVSANVYASSGFGFDRMFDDFRDVSPDSRFPEGIHVGRFGYEHKGEGPKKFLSFAKACATHDHPIESFLNGAAVELDKALASLPVPKLLDEGASIIAREGVKTAESCPQPFFMFTNFMDAHAPLRHVRGYDRSLHDAPNTWSTADYDKWELNRDKAEGLERNREHVENHRGLYRAAIDYLDRTVVEFIDDVQAATDHETTFVITADHGENLGFPADDYLVGHDSSLSEGLLHVPLYVVNAPEDAVSDEEMPDGGTTEGGPGGDTTLVSEYVSHLQLGDLLVGLAHDEVPDVTRERIPAELIGSSIAQPPENPEFWNRMLRCVYDGTEKIEWDSLGESSRVRLDPGRPCWQERVESDVGGVVEELESEFFDEEITAYKRRAEGAEGEGVDVDEATADRLADLGYM
ncbi:sulfatase-like hydrolase/transferase [Salinirubrum litoreum]|uniref:Sulfatase-like hydrolase/transferase n=1 Tax=Salinirubrum litoreum TaxID=1126234 RepID=A0ABD5R8T8_9EURY|nr:sulfatase-like hydrolase/transferase [Salinirubrum litoreum]